MAAIFTRSALYSGKILTQSLTAAPKAFQYTRNFSNLNKSIIAKPQQTLIFSRRFSESKDKLKDGLPEQYEWKANHLEQYLRNFAAKHNAKQEDVDHLIKTFVQGSTAAQDFFKLDRQSLADKIGKDTPERTKLANELVAEVWKETQAVGQKMQNYGAVLVGVAAVIFGAWAYNSFSGDSKDKDHKGDKSGSKSTKESVKGAAHDAKEAVKGAAHDAKNAVVGAAHNAKDAVKDSSKDAKGAAHDAKDSAKGAAQNAKDSAKGAAHDAKDSAKGAAQNVKDSAKDAKGAAHDAKDSAKGAAKDVKSAAKDVKESSKDNKEDAKTKAAQAFKDDGAVGKQFTEKGAIGGAAQKIGGPLDKDGAVGKHFTKDGAIGGAVQKKAEEKEQEHSDKSKEYYNKKNANDK